MKRIALVVGATLIAAAVPAIAIANQPAENTPLHHYIGSLHEHSGYSDGFPGSQPRDYYASAKGYGLDFLGSGEHSDSADLPMVVSEECLAPTIAGCASAEDPADPDHGQDSLRKWDATKEQAQAATTANFTGFRGFEWTSDRFGHINVYFSRNDTNAKVDGGYASMDTFYNWLTRDPLLEGGGDGLATFNHPGDKSQEPLPGLNWNDFTYVPAADNLMAGIEVFNGNKDFGSYYSHALDKGWHLGAIGAEDKGHDPSDGDSAGDDDWGGPNWAKTVFIATDQSEAGLREAMASRRMYAVQDNTIRMDFRAGGHPMGSRISREQGATIGLEFDLWHESVGTATSSPLDRVEFVTNGGAIAAVAPITEGDGPDLTFDAPVAAGESYYFARVIGADGKPLAYSSPVWISRSIAQGGEWLAGDLHIHTTYSHDSFGGPDDENTQDPVDWYTVGHPVTSQFAVALSRGLDYLAITDHNDIRSQTDAGWQFAKDNGLVPIPGYENSLSGHAQMLGAEQIYDKGNATAPEVDAMADALRADGGLFQINHPFDDSGVSWKYGYDVVPDTVEVWNIPRPYQPPFPSATDNDKGTAFWEHFLDAGYHVGATGGADNHYIATTPIQGAGQPTTWVFAKDRSQAAVLEGLREGRTFISHQPPNMGGPQLFLEADADGDGTYEAVVGDTVPAGSNFRARVVGAPGATLRAYTNGGTQAGLDAVVGPFDIPVTPNANSTWIRIEIGYPDAETQREQACDGQLGGETTYCRNKITVLAMTSAIYIQQPHPGTPGATDLI